MAKKQSNLYQRFRQKQNREIETMLCEIIKGLSKQAGRWIWGGIKQAFNFLKNKHKRKKQK